MPVSLTELHARLYDYGGVLRVGKHPPGGRACCALEFGAIMREQLWTDEPGDLPDIRPLNDAFADDAERTRCLLPMVAAFWHWGSWGGTRQRRFGVRVVLRTVQTLIAPLSSLSPALQQQCQTVSTCERVIEMMQDLTQDTVTPLRVCQAAKEAAIHALQGDAAQATTGAARAAAEIAANTASKDASTRVLRLACDEVWIRAARESEDSQWVKQIWERD